MEDYISFFDMNPIVILSFFKPFTGTILIGMIIVAVLLICSGLISASEIAYFYLSRQQIIKIKKNKSSRSQAIVKLLQEPKRLLASILICNNFINVAIVIACSFISMQLFNFGDNQILSFIVNVVCITSLLLVLGEIMPKMIAGNNPEKVAYFMAMPMTVIMRLLKLPSSAMASAIRSLDKYKVTKKKDISLGEISDAIEITGEGDEVKEKNILRGIVAFRETSVKEIMCNRIDIMAIEYNESFSSVLACVIKSGRSRIPVYKETLDRIEGILYIKDLIPYLDKENFHWHTLLREPFYVPESKHLNTLLQAFQEEKVHLAIVVDEYGGTSGIITLEDVIEEIVGEINDEFDAEEKFPYHKIDSNNYIFEAKISINDFCKIVGVDSNIFDDIKGDSDSLGGLILEDCGGIPEKGAVVNLLNFTFEVLDVDSRRIVKIKVTKHNDTEKKSNNK